MKKFHIFNAVLESYLFLQKEFRFLLTLGLFPLAVQFVTTFVMTQYLTQISLIGMVLWSLPSTAVLAWFMFTQTRLILMNERLSDLSQEDIIHNMPRRMAMRASVIIWMLFSMGTGGLGALLFWLHKNQIIKESVGSSMIVILLTVLVIWTFRFSIMHIIAAIDFPMDKFLHKTKGFWLSFYLLGMGLITILPIYFIFGLLPHDYMERLDSLNVWERATFSMMDSISTFLTFTLLNGAACFAIKDMLTPKGTRS